MAKYLRQLLWFVIYIWGVTLRVTNATHREGSGNFEMTRFTVRIWAIGSDNIWKVFKSLTIKLYYPPLKLAIQVFSQPGRRGL